MDGFSVRFNNRRHGYDSIKANAEAEAAEARRLKQQIEQSQKTLAQYESCIADMWKLNQRNAESATALHTLIDDAQRVLANLEAKSRESETAAEQASESEELKALADQIAESEKRIICGFEEIVHRENIKVYRNVQATMMEENGKLSATLGNRKPQTGGINAAILFLVVISLLVSLGNLGITLMQWLGYL
jgi:septal ring factor EnvC (AmiA/AmiB activator)